MVLLQKHDRQGQATTQTRNAKRSHAIAMPWVVHRNLESRKERFQEFSALHKVLLAAQLCHRMWNFREQLRRKPLVVEHVAKKREVQVLHAGVIPLDHLVLEKVCVHRMVHNFVHLVHVVVPTRLQERIRRHVRLLQRNGVLLLPASQADFLLLVAIRLLAIEREELAGCARLRRGCRGRLLGGVCGSWLRGLGSLGGCRGRRFVFGVEVVRNDGRCAGFFGMIV
mmetsp:Transcript_6417/g.15863  ORF Transcript_6417/g.15863 Transcript_6417/m.15863 type:complete len:225 (+) Transcript_6417:467-1141(+)